MYIAGRRFGSPARPDYVPRHIPTSIYMDPAFEAEGHELTPEITEALIKQAVLEKDKERIETERAEARVRALGGGMGGGVWMTQTTEGIPSVLLFERRGRANADPPISE